MNEKLIVLIFNILKSKVGLSLAKSGLESFVNHVQLHINLKKKTQEASTNIRKT